jgi:hypothetical protein
VFHIVLRRNQLLSPSHITVAAAHERIVSLVGTDSFAEQWSALGGEAESLAIK